MFNKHPLVITAPRRDEVSRAGDTGAPSGPRVTVGMPVYNGQEFIEQAIRSILDQSFSDLELVICDNASDDATPEICREIVESDKRVRYYRNPTNIGVTDNYNSVFELARGEYFKWASCNDYCARHLIERCVDVLDRRPDAVLCYPRTRVFDVDPLHAEDYEDRLDLQDHDPVWRFQRLIDGIYSRLNNAMNGVIRSETLRKTRLHRPFAGSDYSLLVELVLQGKFIELPERLFFRRINAKAHARMQSEAEMQRRLWPEDKSALRFQGWKLHASYAGAVFRTPLSYWQKCRLYAALLRRLNWGKVGLMRELYPRS